MRCDSATLDFTLRGKKIFLRRPRPADFAQFAELIRSSSAQYRGLLPNAFKGRKQFDEYVQRFGSGDYFGFSICRREDGAIIGCINLFQIVRRHLQSANVGYFVGAPYARQGYATEALQLMLRFALRKLKLHRVEADIQPHNRPSLALVKRAGFQFEGRAIRLVKIAGKWCDHERWAILAENWRPLRRK